MAKKKLRVRLKKGYRRVKRVLKRGAQKGLMIAKTASKEYDLDLSPRPDAQMIWVTVTHKKTGKKYPIPIKYG